ncbi:hypothetical protein [Tuwongella immobilis]|uniref:hypothetical protein n=1 Tax=Tuwongella immobilis TaxID=692036 RepID=UPI001E5B5516|nr:hypothetical protein [Tuwongella immobilis]
MEYGKLISLTANWGEQLAHEVMLGRAIEFTVRVNNLEHTFEIGSSGSWLPWIGVSRLRGYDSLDIVKRSQVQQWLLEFARAADVSCIVESTCLFLQESKWAVWDQGVLHVFTAPGKEEWTSLRRIYVHDGLGADVRGHEVNFVGHQARFGYREYEFPFGPELNSWGDR